MRKTLLALAAVLAAAPAAAYDFIEFQEPLPLDFVQSGSALAASSDRLYWLDDRKGVLYVLDPSGKLLHATEDGQLDDPQGMALAPDGSVYVADTGNSRVAVFDRDGKLLRALGEKGSAPGELRKPRSVAVGADGRVWVSDSGNDRVSVFTQEGVFLFAFGRSGKDAGQFRDPGRIAVDAADDVYVLDEDNDRVQEFDGAARHLKDYQLHGTDFALDEYGFLYMLDPRRGKVMEVGPDGVVLGSFGTEGRARGQFRKAEAVAVDDRGMILVADAGNKRLQRVRLENKLKTSRVPMDVSTKLLVTGPTRVLPVRASALASAAGKLFAWVPRTRQIAVFEGTKETARLGGSRVKGEAAIKDAKGLAASETLGLFVADAGGDKVMSFSLSGEHRAN
ncbi:MAG: SMP-30/gluconolactonase/LRE family protein, partial [Elusimicrobia bacterium]|nr:SMP-30/gluconolactonase/LRE family protein [Elusimicrobiota bacterium]